VPEGLREPRSWRPLRRASEILLGILIVGAPLAVGGVFPHVMVGVALLGGCALLLALVGRRGSVPASPVAWILLGASVMAVVSIVPLPIDWVRAVFHRGAELAAFAPEPAPARVPLSLDPPATIMDAARLWGLLAVFLAAACLASRSDEARRMARLVAFAGIAVSFVSAAHVALGIPELYGVIPHHLGDRSLTTFVDPNHAASLAILSTLACLGLSSGRGDPLDRWGWWLGAAACFTMGLSTQSAAGLLSMAIALSLFVVLSVRRKIGLVGSVRLAPALLSGLATFAGVVAFLALALFLTDTWDLVTQKALSKLGPWPRVVGMIRESWLTGVGAGAFSPSFEKYMPPGHDVTVTHPENFLLQWAAEWGVPAAIVAVGALAVTFWDAYRMKPTDDDRMGAVHDALLAGTLAVLIHDLADFGLEYAGVGVPFVVALAILAARSGRRFPSRWLAATVGVGAAAAAVIAATNGLPRLVETQITQAGLRVYGLKSPAIERMYAEILRQHPADSLVPIRAAEALANHSYEPITPHELEETLRRTRRFLDRAASLTENDAPSMSKAWVYAREGDRERAMEQLREAFARGRRWTEIGRFALSLDATPEELAKLPLLLKGAPRNGTDDPVVQSAAALLSASRDMWQVRLIAKAVTAAVLRGDIPEEAEVLEPACRSMAQDAWCASVVGFGCDFPEDSQHIAIETIRLGQRWAHDRPDEPASALCLSSGYWALGASDERVRVLATASARMRDDLKLRGWLALAEVEARHPLAAMEEVKDIIPESASPEVAQLIRSARIRALWGSGRHAKALREAEDAVALNPEAFWAYVLAASFNEYSGHYDAALAFLARGMRFHPSWQDADVAAWQERLLKRRDEAAGDPDAIARAVGASDSTDSLDDASAGSESSSGSSASESSATGSSKATSGTLLTSRSATVGKTVRRRYDPITESELRSIEAMGFR
jgi:tetratricopeptide (TPR) repeat protein/O-antigen ligase